MTLMAYLGFCKGGAWHKWPIGKYASDWHYAT